MTDPYADKASPRPYVALVAALLAVVVWLVWFRV